MKRICFERKARSPGICGVSRELEETDAVGRVRGLGWVRNVWVQLISKCCCRRIHGVTIFDVRAISF